MRKLKTFFPVALLALVLLWSCNNDDDSYSNADGIKELLNLSAKNALSSVGSLGGYLNNDQIKILLPGQIQNFSSVAGLSDLANKLITGMNTTAEDVASGKEALPILQSAVKNVSILDAAGILLGGDKAATNYLKEKTYDSLKTTYNEKIDNSLNKNLVGDTSTNEIWNSFKSLYNTGVDSGLISGESLNLDLSDYVTSKALDGLFTKMGQEEAEIRENPSAYGNDILSSVLGKFKTTK